tara:strand:+ start:241 stop:525 length:285 start_codon:yes stop_codon:yes gene_type:complete
MLEILLEIAKLTPVVGLLVVGLLYFVKNEKSYKTEIKELNKVIRDNEKENLIMINKLADAIDNIASQGGLIHNDIMLLKEIIKLKLDELKNNLN